METPFTIETDKQAEWALRKIKTAQQERDRLLALIKSERERLDFEEHGVEEQYTNDTEFLLVQLQRYMSTVKAKETATQRSYKLLSGTLIAKKPSVKLVKDDATLIAWCKENGKTGFIKVEEKLAWAELKKTMKVNPEMSVVVDDETGEVVEGIAVTEEPGKFDIKFAKEAEE